MTHNEGFDRTVGRIAGAIYGDILERFPEPPMMMIPPITFKVRKAIEPFTDIRRLTTDQKKTLAEDIRVAIIPMLYSYEIDPEEIEKLAPVIESAAYAALVDEST